MPDLNPAIDLLAANLGQLNTADGEQLNYLPMQADIKAYGMDQATEDYLRELPKRVAEGIILLLDQHGHINHREQAGVTPDTIVNLACAQCSGPLLTVNTARPISGRSVIEQMAHRDPSCSTKHGKLTPELIRQRIQQQMADDDV